MMDRGKDSQVVGRARIRDPRRRDRFHFGWLIKGKKKDGVATVLSDGGRIIQHEHDEVVMA